MNKLNYKFFKTKMYVNFKLEIYKFFISQETFSLIKQSYDQNN